MDLQHSRNRSLCLNKSKNLMDEIVNINKFKALDDRYIITNICKDTDYKYEFTEDKCNIFHKAFSLSVNFNNQIFKSITSFIDLESFKLEDEHKFIKLFGDLLVSKNINVNINYLKNILHEVLDNKVKEIKEIKDEFSLYINKILTHHREYVFVMVSNL